MCMGRGSDKTFDPTVYVLLHTKYKMSEPQLRTRHRPVYAASVAKCAAVALNARDDEDPAKPDPSALQAIARVWGCELGPELVMVGDSPTHDAGAGHKPGYLRFPDGTQPADRPARGGNKPPRPRARRPVL
jgi:hypothetical protein